MRVCQFRPHHVQKKPLDQFMRLARKSMSPLMRIPSASRYIYGPSRLPSFASPYSSLSVTSPRALWVTVRMRVRLPPKHHLPSIRVIVHEPSRTCALCHGPPRKRFQLCSSQPEPLRPVESAKVNCTRLPLTVPESVPVPPSA